MRKIETLRNMLDLLRMVDNELDRHGYRASIFTGDQPCRTTIMRCLAQCGQLAAALPEKPLTEKESTYYFELHYLRTMGSMLAEADNITAQQFCIYDLRQYMEICQKLTTV